MDEIVTTIIIESAKSFGIHQDELCSGKRVREVVMARKLAALLCRKEGIPARLLANRLNVTRWSVNRLQSEALREASLWFTVKVREVSEKICTEKAHKNN